MKSVAKLQLNSELKITSRCPVWYKYKILNWLSKIRKDKTQTLIILLPLDQELFESLPWSKQKEMYQLFFCNSIFGKYESISILSVHTWS